MVLVVDVVEGVQINTEKIIQYAVHEDLPMTLVINKVCLFSTTLDGPLTNIFSEDGSSHS